MTSKRNQETSTLVFNVFSSIFDSGCVGEGELGDFLSFSGAGRRVAVGVAAADQRSELCCSA